MAWKKSMVEGQYDAILLTTMEYRRTAQEYRIEEYKDCISFFGSSVQQQSLVA